MNIESAVCFRRYSLTPDNLKEMLVIMCNQTR
ncbi:hypothetical protein T07_7943 [Trichinella nelsoni]|uniref:Uncharacterized protein n=1 Tax=Trichinella nelsoni TaxID=6336 RepID=A0A0V0RBA8_9BILA|nr:hypothetical protein T07_7943 [Trichinella nelsoni]